MSKSKRKSVSSSKDKKDSPQDIVEENDSHNTVIDDHPVHPVKVDGSGIGARLRELREEKGLSREDIFNDINIPVTSLTAFENENFEQLPADIFVRGQLILYGNLLGLDGKETATLFLQAREQQLAKGSKNNYAEPQPQRSLSAKKLAEPAHISSATVAGILLFVIVAFITTFCLYTGWSPFAYFLEKEETTVSRLNSDTRETESGEQDNDSNSFVPATEIDEVAATRVLESEQRETEEDIKDNDSQKDEEPVSAAQPNEPGD